MKGSEQDRLDFEKKGTITRNQLGYIMFNLGAEIRRRADVMLSTEAVERYLAILDAQMPALAAVTRHYFSIDRLTARLREQLRKKIPIKNLPEVLEKFLEEVD